ncbi:hypothetical protein [Nostoc sp.]
MSSFLLDTHAFIWLTENDSSLPDNLRMMITYGRYRLSEHR